MMPFKYIIKDSQDLDVSTSIIGMWSIDIIIHSCTEYDPVWSVTNKYI